MIGGYFDRYGDQWGEDQMVWFEKLLEEQDVDIMGWAMGTIPVPLEFQGSMMDALRKLDFVHIPR